MASLKQLVVAVEGAATYAQLRYSLTLISELRAPPSLAASAHFLLGFILRQVLYSSKQVSAGVSTSVYETEGQV
jgi:hypothetical protein